MLKSIKSILLGSFILICSFITTVYADDIAGSKDHPLLTRYPDSSISSYSKNYNSSQLAVGTNQDGSPLLKPIEGEMTSILYFYNHADTQPSPLQVIRNYQNAVKQLGGEIVYERLPVENDGGETTLKVTAADKEHWIKVKPEIYSAPTQSYILEVIETTPMLQLVSAKDYLDELNKNGYVTLYINFDTGKWDIKPDSNKTISELATMLNSAPELEVSIEGHTDNIGTAVDNKILAEHRAESVMAALVQSGVANSRLSAKGFGQEKPIADNQTEDGRAKNRRVELVKKQA
ncbi:MAG: OmpA family protein [Bdellovibrionota bacterium]